MMDADERLRIMAANEGHVLMMCGQCGAERACDVTRAAVDGNVNALIRVEGREAAARYVFALGDRVAGGLREVTAWRPIVPEPEKHELAWSAPVASVSVAFDGSVVAEPAPADDLVYLRAARIISDAGVSEARRAIAVRRSLAAVFVVGLFFGVLLGLSRW